MPRRRCRGPLIAMGVVRDAFCRPNVQRSYRFPAVSRGVHESARQVWSGKTRTKNRFTLGQKLKP